MDRIETQPQTVSPRFSRKQVAAVAAALLLALAVPTVLNQSLQGPAERSQIAGAPENTRPIAAPAESLQNRRLSSTPEPAGLEPKLQTEANSPTSLAVTSDPVAHQPSVSAKASATPPADTESERVIAASRPALSARTSEKSAPASPRQGIASVGSEEDLLNTPQEVAMIRPETMGVDFPANTESDVYYDPVSTLVGF